MRLIDKIKKFFEPPKQCSTCKYWRYIYDRAGFCVSDFPPTFISPVTDCEHVCQLYEWRVKNDSKRVD